MCACATCDDVHGTIVLPIPPVADHRLAYLALRRIRLPTKPNHARHAAHPLTLATVVGPVHTDAIVVCWCVLVWTGLGFFLSSATMRDTRALMDGWRGHDWRGRG